jgi:hypothetical protein
MSKYTFSCYVASKNICHDVFCQRYDRKCHTLLPNYNFDVQLSDFWTLKAAGFIPVYNVTTKTWPRHEIIDSS